MSDSLRIEVPEKLFAPAESLSFTGTFALPAFKQGADTYAFEAPLDWNVQVTNTGGALLVSGTVAGAATTECVRCLDPAQYDLTGEVEGYYLIPGRDADVPDEEREEYELLGEDHIIDLEPLFIAALSLAVPLTPLCDDDCKGLCAGCGANLNHEPCTCDAPADEGFPSEKPNPFSVLKTIKFDD